MGIIEENAIIMIMTFLNLIGLGFCIKKGKLTVKLMCIIGIFVGVSVVFRMITIPTPLGSKINMLATLPAMLIAILYGSHAGVWVGVLTGILIIFVIPAWAPMHLLQIPIEHIGAFGALGYAGLLGNESKAKVMLASIIAILVNVIFHIFSGALFFAMYAPEGMGSWTYSITYNLTGNALVGVLSIIVIGMLPLKQFKKIIGGK